MKILEPITIKEMKLKNRIGFAPWLGMPIAADGSVTNETVRWDCRSWAEGGVGFIMTGTMESESPDATTRPPIKMEAGACIYDDQFIRAGPGWLT